MYADQVGTCASHVVILGEGVGGMGEATKISLAQNVGKAFSITGKHVAAWFGDILS